MVYAILTQENTQVTPFVAIEVDTVLIFIVVE